MKNIKRRFFIKSSSLVAGGLVLPSFNINRMANSSNNKKLKVSVVGCGGRGTGAAVQALRADDNVELVAMADAFKDSFNQFANKKQEILTKLADTHEERIINTLKNLEDEIIADLTSITDGGAKLNTRLAMELRPNLKRLIQENFLKEAGLIKKQSPIKDLAIDIGKN